MHALLKIHNHKQFRLLLYTIICSYASWWSWSHPRWKNKKILMLSRGRGAKNEMRSWCLCKGFCSYWLGGEDWGSRIPRLHTTTSINKEFRENKTPTKEQRWVRLGVTNKVLGFKFFYYPKPVSTHFNPKHLQKQFRYYDKLIHNLKQSKSLFKQSKSTRAQICFS